MKIDQDTCIACGGPLSFFCKQEGKKIFKCPNCGLGITANLAAKTSNYHRDYSYISEEELFRNIFLKRVNILTRFTKPGKVLEIGCSTGIMLSLLKERGWLVEGIEVSRKSAEVAQKRGLDVKIKDFEKDDIEGKYDLVILNHTFEHLRSPDKALKKIRSILNPRGLLFIDLPNFSSLSAKILGGRWPLLLPEEHYWHFTLESLTALLNSYYFRIIYSDNSSGIWDFGDPLGEVINSLSHLKRRFLGEVVTAIPTFIVSKLQMGTSLTVLSRKKL